VQTNLVKDGVAIGVKTIRQEEIRTSIENQLEVGV
jgi:hypothetical protein